MGELYIVVHSLWLLPTEARAIMGRRFNRSVSRVYIHTDLEKSIAWISSCADRLRDLNNTIVDL